MTDWHAREWEAFGRSDPYYGVIAEEQFRSAAFDDSARTAFFDGGAREVAETLDTMRLLAGPTFHPGRTLDFGCGVARLTIPLARTATSVLGVDTSPAMLDHARANCARAGITNVNFVLSLPNLGGVEGPFDFVHSSIVFQHIPPKIGYALLDSILDRLAPHGGGMLHFTYDRKAPLIRRMAHKARRASRLAHRVLNIVQRRPMGAPLMAMFEYDISAILAALEARGINRIVAKFTNHGGHLGISFFFSRTEPTAS